MQTSKPPPRFAAPGVRVSLLLLVALLAVNGAAIGGLFAARQNALEAAREDLRLQTLAHARALEAALAGLRGDLIFLTQAPPLGQGLANFDSPDPTTRRWSRRDVEGALLLFLDTRPGVDRALVRDVAGRVRIAAGRRDGAPVLLRVEALAPGASAGAAPFVSRWRLGGTLTPLGDLEIHLLPDHLLTATAPGFRGELRLSPPGPANREVLLAEVRDPQWEPPVHWTLVVDPRPGPLPQPFEALAGRYRRTVIFNLVVVALTLPLGALAFRQIRRAAQLQAENEQQARVRALEVQLQHNERLASLGRLAAGLAHEINNPLAGMANYLSLLEEDLRTGRTEGALGLAERVREGLDRTARVTRGMLAFARPAGAEAGAAEAAPARVELDLLPTLDAALELVRADPAGRRLEFSPPAAAPANPAARVVGDPTLLGQLFFNLLLNACQAQPEGGRVDLDLQVTAGTVVVTIADRGPGLPRELAERIFEPFVSTRGSTGLGLAVCWSIAGQHGGTLQAADRPGGGAVLTVTLPRAPGGSP